MNILGLSAYYHDSAACLIQDGSPPPPRKEWWTRKKHALRFPAEAVAYCLREGGPQVADLGLAAFFYLKIILFW